MNLNKPISTADNHQATVVIGAGEYRRAAKILAEYLGKITDGVFQIQETTTVSPSILLKSADHGTDGFSYRIYDKDIEIEAGNEQGKKDGTGHGGGMENYGG